MKLKETPEGQKFKPIDKEYEVVELSAIKIKQLNKQPIMESFFALSENKKWGMHKTVITDVKPVEYFEKVFGVKLVAR